MADEVAVSAHTRAITAFMPSLPRFGCRRVNPEVERWFATLEGEPIPGLPSDFTMEQAFAVARVVAHLRAGIALGCGG